MKSERIALDDLGNGYRVSTVRVEDEDQTFYETMVFDRTNDGVWCCRTRDATLARRNHAKECEHWGPRACASA